MLSALARFHLTMAEQLEANSHKTGWRHLTAAQCLRRARQELRELERALRSGTTKEIQHEAADAADFLMFLSENAASYVEQRTRFPKPPARRGMIRRK